MSLSLVHGSADSMLFPEYMEITLTGGAYKPLYTKLNYIAVREFSAVRVAGLVSKMILKYMATGKIEGQSDFPASLVATAQPKKLGGFYIKNDPPQRFNFENGSMI